MQTNKANPLLTILKRISQIILLFVLVIGIIVTIVASMVGVSMVSIAKKSPNVNATNIILSLNENSKILDKNGNLIESIALDEYREIVELNDIPKYLVDAFISIEDEGFYDHSGVSLRGILRSFLENVRADGIVQGGSTLTQQLVKNVFLSSEVRFERKITEMYLAMQVEKQLSKDEILTAYLNRVFLGQHAYGVEAAAQTYFSKSVKDLTIAEAATMASIVQAPSRFSLFQTYPPASVPEGADVIGDFNISGVKLVAVRNPEVLERKDWVLDKMLELEKITQEEYDKAKLEDVMASVKPGQKKTIDYASQISSLIKDEAVAIIMKEKDVPYEEAKKLLYTGGFEVFTTIDWEAQKKLEEAYEEFFSFVSNRNGSTNLGVYNYDEFGDIVDKYGNKIYYKKSNLLTEDNNLFLPNGWYTIEENGDLQVSSSRFSVIQSGIYVLPFYQFNDNGDFVSYRVSIIEIPREFLVDNEDGFKIKKAYFDQVKDFYSIVDGNLVINNAYYSVETHGTVQPQSATVVLDSRTAEIVAVVGGRGNSPDDTIERASSYFRSPGSTMKPLAAYAPSVELGRTLAQPIDDTPYMMLNGSPWPKNAYAGYYGIVTTRESLLRSMNPTAVKLMDEIGIDKSMDFLTKFGIINAEDPSKDTFVTAKENATNNDENNGMSLGSMVQGVSVMDIAGAYQTFANGGERVNASIISKIVSREGDLYVNNHTGQRVISEETNFLMTDVMRQIANQPFYAGTANPNGIDTAGKTGTTDDNADFWFAGYNPYYTAATWIGFDDARIGLVGNSGVASTFWATFMNKMLEDKEPVQFNKPETIVTAEVSKVDGLLPSELTKYDPRGNMVYTEYFKQGTVPTTQSNGHIRVRVDTRNNLLAGNSVPKFLTAEKVFMNRPIPYDPTKFDGVEPADWQYTAPTTYSNLPWKEEVKRTKLADGSAQEVVTRFNGNVEVTIRKPDGTVIHQVTTPEGKVTTTTTRPVTPQNNNSNNNNSNNNNSNNNNSNDSNNSNNTTPTTPSTPSTN